MHEELIARLEAATGPDRELDALIWLRVGEQMGGDWHARGSTPIRPSEIIQGRWMGSALEKWTGPENIKWIAASYCVPAFTASIDAALTLVPGEWLYSLGREEEDGFYFYPYGEGASDASHAATPALAICIASLKARRGEG